MTDATWLLSDSQWLVLLGLQLTLEICSDLLSLPHSLWLILPSLLSSLFSFCSLFVYNCSSKSASFSVLAKVASLSHLFSPESWAYPLLSNLSLIFHFVGLSKTSLSNMRASFYKLTWPSLFGVRDVNEGQICISARGIKAVCWGLSHAVVPGKC